MTSTQTIHERKPYYDRNSPQENSAIAVNVSRTERWLSTISGGVLVAYGVARFDRVGAIIAASGGYLLFRGLTGHSYLYQALDIMTVEESPDTLSTIPGRKGTRVRRRITVARPVEELYAFWHDVENAPLYMQNIESVEQTGKRTSHWRAKNLLGKAVEWNSEILEDIPDQLIAWHIHGHALTGNAGKVRFEAAPADLGTIVTLECDFFQPSGLLGTSLGKMASHVPEYMLQQNLRQFKALMEAGEIATTKGQPTGKVESKSALR